MLFGLTVLAATQTSTGLRPLADKIRLNLGAAVQSDFLRSNIDDGKYQRAILENFTMIEPENDLKPPALWQGIGKYDFSKPDFLIEWAKKNKLKVRGHVLVYASDPGYTIPKWLLDMERDITPEQAKTMLHDYILAVAGRYKGKIIAWDVINEAIDDKPNTNPFNLRNSFWFRKLGVDFLTLSFQFAHEADPRCKLYYNDYSVENGGVKGENMLKMVDYLISKKAPIHGVGLQFHRWMVEKPVPGDKFHTMLAQIQNRKLKFQMTELDLSMPIVKAKRGDPTYGLIPVDSGDIAKQADSYRAFVKMALSFKNCDGIQLWGINDARSWIPNSTGGGRGAALLLDKDYQPKPAYDAFAEALRTGKG
jgi:endo-1,4-beta-xylanase